MSLVNYRVIARVDMIHCHEGGKRDLLKCPRTQRPDDAQLELRAIFCRCLILYRGRLTDTRQTNKEHEKSDGLSWPPQALAELPKLVRGAVNPAMTQRAPRRVRVLHGDNKHSIQLSSLGFSGNAVGYYVNGKATWRESTVPRT